MDNFYQNCPAVMNDGRFLRDFQNETKRNDYIKNLNGMWRDDQYRFFLQQNGNKIMDREWQYYKKNNYCHPNECVHNYPTRTSNKNFINEKIVYNSLFDNNNKQYEPMRKCQPFRDYRIYYPN
ncbi:Hypothetical protein KVN_LOCUS456 [uncultured virus]|nr:Hypothetical protein KVN_LOCUS456 [uncultured virus]